MSNQDFSKMGERIQSIVEDAIDSMDFDSLNNNIRGSIQSVFEELHIDTSHKDVRYHSGRNSTVIRKAGTGEDDSTEVLPAAGRFLKNPPGSISGVLWTTFGGIFTGIFGMAALVVGVVGLAIPGIAMAIGITMASLLPLLGVSAAALCRGVTLRGRIRRFQAYKRTIGQRTYCQIEELAAAIGKKNAFVVKDLQDMMNRRFFRAGHLDAQKTYLMLDEETYQQYLDTQEAYHQRVLEEKKQAQSDREVFSANGIDNQELAKAIEEGNRYIRQIRNANDAIPGEEISLKLFRLEAVIKKIFEVLKQKPDQLPKLRKFMNYYMPTTLKLVTTYQQLDAQPVEGENIRRSKREIETTLDTINEAYERLLDSFFEDAALDISSDITVLQTMLAQEGLTKREFEKQVMGERKHE